MGKGRAFKIEKGEDKDEQLFAIRTFDSSGEVAGSYPAALCKKHGVGRHFVS
jgi:hypothetical protein